MRLVFMGTPVFVVPVLDALVKDSDIEIAGVYTPPDRRQGRGRSSQMPPVKAYALEHGLPVFQPASLRREDVQQEMASLKPEVIVVAAYGKFLPSAVLNIPPSGCLNLHPSRLPKHRGPSPVITTILEGDETTGVTLMLLDEGMDTGPIIAQCEQAVSPEDTAETLTAALFQLGASLLSEQLAPWVAGELTARPQDDSLATVTRKLERGDGEADWNLSSQQLNRRGRAFTPWPGLFTHWRGQVLKLLEVTDSLNFPELNLPGVNVAPGRVVRLDVAGVPAGIGTAHGVLGLKKVQLEGRSPTAVAEFLKGYPQFIGAQL
ncbi:MAG: methionyl-tRNA formyltransferase [Chloroflexi bacterium]|nr:methionyl-tRNA formyltransferase [Chloroflexota bacterium]